ncbi:uncharacterized protein LOC126611831 [Malus sylvestris]|uniref:uncharacterized protein LOC126611831 n=1 Tax=Malus sylvestris TaxID=3752 RepID=UPI0021AC1CF4|nr:uncharacterized protein LOC126611831 [Malus sylvestris]
MIDSALEKGPKFPKFIYLYLAYVEKFEYPKGFKIPDFSLFARESSLSSLEHVARFTVQCGDVNSDFHKLRLFNLSLTGSAFAWYINLPPNSIQNWEELVEKFHEQFYRPGIEMSVSSLARMAQASDESPMDYLTSLPKTCQEALDLALTCPDAEQIIQKTTDPAMKAKFQHICEARVLDFEVNPYTDLDTTELIFSLEDLQYLRHHFKVFSAVSLFGLTADEKE